MVDDVAEAFRKLEAWRGAVLGRVYTIQSPDDKYGPSSFCVSVYGPDDMNSDDSMAPNLPAAVEAALRAAGGGE